MAHVREMTRKAGTAFEVRWRDGIRERQRTFGARRAADRFALRIENEIADGQSTEPWMRGGKTFREVADAMLAASAPNLKPKTVAEYELAYRLHVFPTFGDRRIAAITSLNVERWLADLCTTNPPKTGKPPAAASLRGTLIALGRVFGYGMKHRLIAVDPTDAADVPRKASVEHVLRPSRWRP